MYKKILEYSYVNNDNQKTFLNDSVRCHCRFCGKTKTKNDFRKKAHAVSEGIGNKSIFTSYECDECNQHFADNEENELGKLFQFYKATHGKKGKNGAIKLMGAQFSFSENNTFSAHIDMREKRFDISIEKAPNGALSPKFKNKVEINFRLVYQAFIKFALSVIPEDIATELKQGYVMLRNNMEFPSYKGNIVLFYDEISSAGIAIYKSSEETENPKYFCTIDAYQLRFVIPLEFQKSMNNAPTDLIGAVFIPFSDRSDWGVFDYCDEAREIIQEEQPYPRA